MRGFSWYFLWALGLVWMVAIYLLIFLWVPEADVPEGIAQKIFYIHVPVGWLSLLSFLTIFIASILYLLRGWWFWDIVSYSMAEIGTLFTSLSLITGILWGKPTWLQWWVWDPRLSTVLVLWIIYLAYLLLRAYAPGAQAARFCSVLGIIGFIDVPIVYFSTRWWRTLHPGPMLTGGGFVDPSMRLVLMLSVGAFTLFFILISHLHISLRGMEFEISQQRQRMEGL